MNSESITRRSALIIAAGALSACAAAPEPTRKKSKTRDIPISLWLGEGAPDDEYPTVDIVSGKNKNRRIRGPFDWIDPRTGDRHLVYERTKTRKRRLKRQIFAVTQKGEGLGRLLDERTERAPRSFKGEVMFPLGTWKRGERRKFKAKVYTVVGPARRTIEIRIRRLDYTFRGVEHSLKFDWISKDAAGRTLFRERYIFSPGEGLVKFEDLLKRKKTSSST